MDRGVPPFTRVAVFGGATIDRIAQSAGAPISGASNPGTIRSAAGGVGLNLALVLARLGLATRLVARIGADVDGEAVIAAVKRAGVDTAAVGVSRRAPTARYLATLDDRGGLIIGVSDMRIYEEMTPAVVAPAVSATAGDEFWVVDANLPADALAFLVAEARSLGRAVAAVAVSPAKAARLLPLLGELTLLFANRREAAALLKRDWLDEGPSATDLALGLSGALTPNVVVTNGGDPLAIASHGEVRSFVPLDAKVRSVNGAGDAFAAGMIYGMSDGSSLFAAALSGLAAAALTVESESVIQATYTPRQLAERIGAPGRAGS